MYQLRNTFYFNKLWTFFDSVDTDKNQNISYEVSARGSIRRYLRNIGFKCYRVSTQYSCTRRPISWHIATKYLLFVMIHSKIPQEFKAGVTKLQLKGVEGGCACVYLRPITTRSCTPPHASESVLEEHYRQIEGSTDKEVNEHCAPMQSCTLRMPTYPHSQVPFDEWVKYFAASFHPLPDDLDSTVITRSPGHNSPSWP